MLCVGRAGASPSVPRPEPSGTIANCRGLPPFPAPTRRSRARRYFRRPHRNRSGGRKPRPGGPGGTDPPPGSGWAPRRLLAMRVRLFELRLIAATLTTLWTIAAGLVLLGYRPGGPIDVVVGLVAMLPIPISLAALIWPPAARGRRAFASVVWLGLTAILVLIPSIAAILGQLLARGPQTLLPSWEEAYPVAGRARRHEPVLRPRHRATGARSDRDAPAAARPGRRRRR